MEDNAEQSYRDTSKNRIDHQINRFKGASEYAREELKRMHRELTDDDFIAENKRKTEREARLQEKVDNTGYFL